MVGEAGHVLTREAGVKQKPAATWRTWLRRLAPWVLTGTAILFILRKYSLEQIVEEMGEGDALILLPIALGLTLSIVGLVAYWDYLCINGFLGRPRFYDVLRGKAGMSILLTLGYGFGHGGYAVWIARVTGASIGQTAGVALYITASDLCALSTVATATIWFGSAEVPPALQIIPPIIAGSLYLCALIGPFRLFGGKLPTVFQPWATMSRARQLGNIFGRVFNISYMVFVTWLATEAFGLEIPFDVVATYLPLIIFVGSLPINIAGFGPVQSVWLLFEPWAPGAAILAFQVLWSLMIGAGLVLRGLPFIRRVVAEITEGRKQIDDPSG